MKFKKSWKRFWTLDHHHAAGFTLVELIVVIAILAILAGVGIPVYSGYVTKANKQADMTLISEIEHALTLAGYTGTFVDGETGYIILSAQTPFTSEQAGEGSNLDKAFKATFGENYTLQLKYDNWLEDASILSWLIGVNAEGFANNTYNEIVNVANSSFLTGNTTSELLSNVESLTTKLAGIVDGMDQAGKSIVYDMFTTTDGYGNSTNALQTVMTEYGYSSLDDVNATTLSNLVVMAAAEEMRNMDSAAQMNGAVPSAMSEYVTYYALYTAYAANENSSQEYKDKYAQLQVDIQSESNPANIMVMLNSFQINLTGDGNNIPADSGWVAYSGGDNPVGSTYFKDVDAFSDIMNAVNNAAVSKDDLGNSTLFTQGAVNTLFGSYVSAVDMISEMDPDTYEALIAAQGNGVTVVYFYDGNSISVSSSLSENN